MRLKIAYNDGPLQKLQYAVIRRLVGNVPGFVKLFSYRRSFFGRRFAGCVQECLRARGEWSAGELEIFAAFVSRLNRCRY